MKKLASCVTLFTVFVVIKTRHLSLLNYAKEIDAPLTLIKEGYQGEIGLEGAHQRINAAVAIKAIEKLNYLFPVTNNYDR